MGCDIVDGRTSLKSHNDELTIHYSFYTEMNISYVQPHAGSAFQPIPSLKHRHTSEWCRMWIRLGPSCIPQIHREETTATSTG